MDLVTRLAAWAMTAALTAAAGRSAGQTMQAVPPAAAAVTYVGSSGFLIEAGGRKILVDALFDGFPPGYCVPDALREPLLDGQPPFDGVDVILATHAHGDHFSAAAVRRALEINPAAVFVGPEATVAALAGLEARTIALAVPDGERRTVTVRGVTITAMPLTHGTPPPGRPGIVNLAYLITAGGTTFLHTGDIDAQAIPLSYLRTLGLPEAHVDVAFVPHFLLATPVPLPFVTEGLHPRTVVASHLQYTGGAPDTARIRRNFPTAVIFGVEGERWVVR